MSPQAKASVDLAVLRDEVGRAVSGVLVGQEAVLDQMMVALAVGGHVLLEGPPGVGKTLAANAVARALGLSFRRIQFTPDMLPSDITGTSVLQAGAAQFRPGPVFSQILLADEINRTPPKTQAALLEAMQEGQVTVDGLTHPLPVPFVVLATQNPIEYEGTYPLPEAQLDRFLLRAVVGYPDQVEEEAMVRLARRGARAPDLSDIPTVADAATWAGLEAVVSETTVSDEVSAYAVAVVRKTRELPSVALGASPRAAAHLRAAAQALARLRGRSFVTPDDIVELAGPVLAHRLLLQPEAELDSFGPMGAVAAAVAAVPVPR